MLRNLAVLGLFPPDLTGADYLVAIPITLLIVGVKAVEYLTRPAQTARRAARL